MIDTDGALVIAPCAAIHTCFMRFPIDALFVSRSGRVIKCCHSIFPWRIAVAWGAFAVIECAAGTIHRSMTEAGDRVLVAPIASMARLSELHLTDVPYVARGRSLY
jgi:uncharacterized membrane protein (UPF0127 family)